MEQKPACRIQDIRAQQEHRKADNNKNNDNNDGDDDDEINASRWFSRIGVKVG
jgi:hypothetical protein